MGRERNENATAEKRFAYVGKVTMIRYGRAAVVVVRGGVVCQQHQSTYHRQLFAVHRWFSKASSDSSSSPPILESASATMEWKRNQYRKIEERFQQQQQPTSSDGDSEITTSAATTEQSTTTTKPSFPAWPTDNDKPLPITSDDDVQPMWKGMESRVTKRKAFTEADLTRKGMSSGRNNVRKSDEDLWLAAGVYGTDSNDKDDNTDKK